MILGIFRITAPADSHQFLALALKLSAPFTRARRFRGKVRNFRWNTIKPGAERERQAEQRALKVSERKRVALANDVPNAIKSAHQTCQRGRHLQKHGRAHGCNQRRIANCLYDIPQSLFLVQQNRFSIEVSLADPQRLRKCPLRWTERGIQPAPFVFAKPLFVPPKRQVDHALLHMPGEKIWLDAKRGPGALQAFLKSPQACERDSAIGQGIGEGRFDCQRFIKAFERLLVAHEPV